MQHTKKCLLSVAEISLIKFWTKDIAYDSSTYSNKSLKNAAHDQEFLFKNLSCSSSGTSVCYVKLITVPHEPSAPSRVPGDTPKSRHPQN
jgi:hypothetical protein